MKPLDGISEKNIKFAPLIHLQVMLGTKTDVCVTSIYAGGIGITFYCNINSIFIVSVILYPLTIAKAKFYVTSAFNVTIFFVLTHSVCL